MPADICIPDLNHISNLAIRGKEFAQESVHMC